MMLSSVDLSAAPTVCDPQLMMSFPKQSETAAVPLALHYHLILHLERGGLIGESWRKVFYQYVAGCLRSMDCELEAIGGAGDHVHLLVSLNSTDSPAEIARRVKLLSESWVKRKIVCRNFEWREDYQAFTVSLSQRGRVKGYILNRREHGRRAAASENQPSSWGCVSQSAVYV